MGRAFGARLPVDIRILPFAKTLLSLGTETSILDGKAA
jgi:hypothetical protein